MQLDETIAAIAVAPGGAARGIVRLSGPDVLACLQKLFPQEGALHAGSITTATVLQSEASFSSIAAQSLPCDVYFWPTLRSYTRQPVAELHTLGSPPLLAALLRTACEAGARAASPGEFTLRAFLAGRIDLTQAEAVLGVIDARGQSDLSTALTQLAGGLAAPLHALRSDLLDLLAHLEAGLDFVEEDIEFITAEQLDKILGQSADKVADLASQMNARADIQDTVRMVLLGSPNAGKSSLFNELQPFMASDTELVKSKTALVSGEAGTTRDYLSVRMELAGVPCELIDTAGIDPAIVTDEIARAAQDLTDTYQHTAQVRLVCIDATRTPNDWEQAQIEAYLEALRTAEDASDSSPNGIGQSLLIWTKCDELASDAQRSIAGAVSTSSKTRVGLRELYTRMTELALSQAGSGTLPVASTVVRCRESLRQASEALRTARELAVNQGGEELVALEVRSALDALGNVVGAIYTDDVLDRVFSRFCIGK